ncbi:extensin-2-like [Phalaenopsis equestris]|uniref:extensin-2-like n=1 Tax=Phalaenopsis equestris TaxID=78828 RepID=UPI0009E50099|nr:extensin-2-like [Phalaenopsis equestris]
MVLPLAFFLSINNLAFASNEPQQNYSPSPPITHNYNSPPPSSPYDYQSSPYNSSPPPVVSSPPSYYNSPPQHHHHELLVKVVGSVYCFNCYDWKQPLDSHIKKPLEDAIVKVTCDAGDKTYVSYGKTKHFGKYSVNVKGFPFWKHRARACRVELHAAPKGSKCKIPTNLNKGAPLKVIVKSHELVVLKAETLAFAPKIPYEDCEKPKPSPYNSNSPPPPTLANYYQSPPSSSPTYYSIPPASSPSLSTSSYEKSSPPPSLSPSPPYYYDSPPQPSPSAPPYYYGSSLAPSPTFPPTYYYKSPSQPSYSSSSPYYYNSPQPPPLSSTPPY